MVVDDESMGLNKDQYNQTYSYKSKWRKKFYDNIVSPDFDIGVLTYKRGGSFPVWISCFRIPHDDNDMDRNVKGTESKMRLSAPCHYRREKLMK